MNNYTIRKIQKKDIKIMKDLWKLHFGEVIAGKRIKSFNWIVADNPCSKTKDDYYIMEEEDKIIAYGGMMPSKFYVTGKDYDGYIYHDTMVDPAQRRRGIATKLYKEMAKLNPCFCIAAWMNAPNAGALKKSGWKPVNNLNRYVRGYNAAFATLTKWNILNKILIPIINIILAIIYKFEKVLYFWGHKNLITLPVEAFDERVDTLFHNVKKEFLCIIYRTKDILNWKYSQKFSPEYSKLICINGEELLGFIVFRTRKSEEGKTEAAILDFLCSPKRKDVFTELLKRAILEIEKQKPDTIEIFCSNSNFLNVLKRFGFIKSKKEFALKYLNHDSIAGSERLSNGDNWFITHGDSDRVFFDL